MEPLLVMLAFAAVVALVGWPWLRRGDGAATERDAERIEDLLASRESTYRQIRELELDHRTGKLAREDFRAQDRVLRAHAIEILRELDELGVGMDGDAKAPAEPVPATLQKP
jgi:hypothetical protein